MEAARDAARGLIGLEPHYVKIVGSPGELAAMSSENVATIWPRMVSAGFSFDNRVAARILLNLPPLFDTVVKEQVQFLQRHL